MTRPELAVRLTIVVAVLTVLFVPVARPVAEYVTEEFGRTGFAGSLALVPAFLLFGAIVVGGVELSFAGRTLTGRITGPFRRRQRAHARIIAAIAIGALALAVPVGLWSGGGGTRYSWTQGPMRCLLTVLAWVAVATMGLLASAVYLGIANRLAFRALERRRAGRDPKPSSTAGSPASGRP